ncbi:MAG: FAD-dependent monooxygenase [Alphaproteobacteria bacterium]|nr:FAD-dependent monooxygenase [Alphaproteobacteria bacterium]
MTEYKENADIAVVGGGLSSLTVSILLAHAGFSIRAFMPPVLPDTRTTALLSGSVSLLKRMGIWPQLQDCAAPITAMRLIDDTGRLFRAPSLSFSSYEFGHFQFGFNVINRDLIRKLDAYATILPTLTISRQKIIRIIPEDKKICVFPSEGSPVQAKLVVGADGSNSLCRESAGITFSKKMYDQTALTFNISHTLSHKNVSTEFHTRTGPFTLVPLPCNMESSVVWVVKSSESSEFLALPDHLLIRKIQERSHGLIGHITSVNSRGSFPSFQLTALRMASNRVALVGDSGHVLPPIGAQGLNLGLRDTAMLAEILEKIKQEEGDIGAPSTLSAYNRHRQSDVATRACMTDLLNRSILSDSFPSQIIRGAGSIAAKRSALIRNFLVKLSLNSTSQTPRLMREEN